MPLLLFLDQHSPVTRTMFHSLVIEDPHCTMSPRDMGAIVNLINLDLPQLRVFGVKSIGPSAVTWFADRVNTYCMGLYRTTFLIQPVARLRPNIRTFLELPFLLDTVLNGPRIQPAIASTQRYMCTRLMRGISQIVEIRHTAQRCHTLSLYHGDYLQATLALRSMSDTELPTQEAIARIEATLESARERSRALSAHRTWLMAMRGIHQMR